MANAYVFSATAVEGLTREWIDVPHRDYNHPCIITWVPLNESWGVPNLERDEAQRNYVRGLYHITKAIDPFGDRQRRLGTSRQRRVGRP
jgi:hypothetical protein